MKVTTYQKVTTIVWKANIIKFVSPIIKFVEMKIKTLLPKGFIAGCMAAAANIVIYLSAKLVGAINDSVLLPPGKPLELPPVIFSSLIPAIVASLLLFGLSQFAKNPVRVFTIIGVIFLLISLGGPFGIPNLPASARAILALMHIVAGGLIIYNLRKISNEHTL